MSGQGPGAFERTLENDGVLYYRIKGVSMRPLLRQGRDTVVIRPKQGRLKKYDVALYRVVNGNYVLHRVVKVLPDGYVIRGDNCYYDEPGIPDRAIIGVLSAYVRKGRKRTTDAFLYRLYARIWVASYPLRRFRRMLRGFLTEGLWVHLANRRKQK